MINFDALFREYVGKWIAAHPELMEDKSVDIEEYYPEIFHEWEKTAYSQLDGKTPSEYFLAFEDAEELCSLALSYLNSGTHIPQHLEQRIIDLAEQSAPHLLKWMDAEEEHTRLEAAEILNMIGSLLPMDAYLATVRAAEQSDDLVEACIQGLINMGNVASGAVIQAFDESNGYARDCLMDVMSYLGGEGVLERLLQELKGEENVAFAAKCLEHLGDRRAIAPLKAMLDDPDRPYYEYTALKEAVEDLDMVVLAEKEFLNDADYLYLAEHPPVLGGEDEGNAE